MGREQAGEGDATAAGGAQVAQGAGDGSGNSLIVVGSSAGGIEALSVLVAGLPHDLPAPLIVAQHLDPARPSQLEAILGRRSTLPVRLVADHAPLAPGVVYVVPSNRHVAVTDHTVTLLPNGASERPAPSIDMLLASAAEVFGERLIAVILSGTGHDGAAGARAVKAAGGTVIIQDPQTAAFPGMPLALAPTTVDIVATLDRIGPLLGELLAGGARGARQETERALDAFLEELRQRFGIDFGAYKRATLLRRLRRRIAATSAGDIAGYLAYLDAHPEEYQHLVSTFLIKVTEFFRDPDLFAALRDEVLPELIAHARNQGNTLRLWSAGCATGEEAYSLAILVAEALGPALDQFTVRVFATDLDEDAIAYARRGLYPAAALAGVSPDLIERYFTREDGGYLIRKRVRGLLVFGQHDLGQRAPFPRLDLALCRNVLIYFTPELQRRALQVFAYALRQGGTLALGKAESVGPAAEYFVPRHPTQKLYRRTGERIPLLLATHAPVPPPPRRLGLPRDGLGRLPAPTALRARGEGYLLRLPTGVVVVDRRYDIQEINGAARTLLGVHAAALGDDLIHTVPASLTQPLREAIDRACRENAPTLLAEVAVEELALGAPRTLRVECVPQMRPDEPNGPVDVVLVVVSDMTTEARTRRALEERLAAATADLDRARREQAAEAASREELTAQLGETNRRLLEANQGLHATVEELRATNEEFQLSAEEAQAATEEAETLNEELQATNEELETVNEELQATVEELETTTEELQARGRELEEVAQTSEERRARLEAMLAGMADAVLVVDDQDRTVLHNDAFARWFGPPDAPLPVSDAAGHPLSPGTEPRARLARGEAFATDFTVTAADGGHRSFEAVGTPVRDTGGGRSWGVLVIRDITARKRDEATLRTLSTRLLEVREAEQRHLARELHDEIGQLLTGLQLALGQARTAEAATIVRELLERVRALTLDLRPAALDDLGLLPALEDYLRRYGVQTGVRAELRQAGIDRRFPPEVETAAYRIVQEALTNVARHAAVDTAIVQLVADDGWLTVQVRDAGRGFDPAAALAAHRSAGLAGMRERAVLLGGALTIDAAPGGGTVVTAELPCRDEPAPDGDSGGEA